MEKGRVCMLSEGGTIAESLVKSPLHLLLF